MQQILESRGYELTCRGSVNVKGKGSMITYFLKAKGAAAVPAATAGAVAELEVPKSLPLPAVEAAAAATDKETTPVTAEEQEQEEDEQGVGHVEGADMEDDDEDEDDIDLNSNMQNMTAQRRKSLCRQHNISSSFGTTASSSGLTPSISNSSSVVTIGALPVLLRNTNAAAGAAGGGASASDSCATPTAPVRTLVAELKEEITRDEKIALKDSIENLEILLKNNISLSDLSNKQQQNLRGEVTSSCSSATATLRKRDTLVSFNVIETLTTTATYSQQQQQHQRKRRSVTTLAASCITTTRLLSNESQSSTQTAPGGLETSGAVSPRAGVATELEPDGDGHGMWQPRNATLEPNRSPIKTSQSMSPIGLASEVYVLPNSRSMILISSTNSTGSTPGGGSSPRAALLQDVST